ncbi:MAG: alanyl-tRNA editing protein [Spirochaetales bacterium]
MSDQATQALYYEEPAPMEFRARVMSIEGKDGREVVLDRTAFYPEGGGQPADRGTLEGIAVTDVSKRDGVIYHRLAERPGFDIDASITGVVDRSHRREYQQQHTGQHILSAALFSRGLATLSVHQGEEYTSIEVDAEEIAPEILAEVETHVNAVIEADLPITATLVPEAEIGNYPLRRPPKVGGTIRVVQIGDQDCVACGGVHLSRTGQVRLVRTLGTESIRGNTRILYAIGDRALAHYRLCADVVSELGAGLSAKPAEIPVRVAKLRGQVASLTTALARANEKIASLIAAGLVREAVSERAADSEGPLVIAANLGTYEAAFVRSVMEKLLVAERVVAALSATQPEGDGSARRMAWSIGASLGVDFDFNAHREKLLAPIEGKGGGRAPIWQGVGREAERESDFLNAFREIWE